MAVALGLTPQNALLNDVNPQLINFYRQVQRGLELKIEMGNEQTLFYQQRERFNELMHASKVNGNGNGTTRRLRSCSLTRSSSAFLLSQPHLLQRSLPVSIKAANSMFRLALTNPSLMQLISSPTKKLFRNWTFSNSDFESIPFTADDFIYADPPYDVEFTTYSAGGFSWEDQVRTAELLSEHKGPVVISNQATRRIVSLYKRLGFKLSYWTRRAE